MSMMTRLFAALIGVFVLAFAGAISSAAQTDGASFTVSPESGAPGDSIEVSGQCSAEDAGGTVAVIAGDGFIEPGQWGTAPVGEDGSFSATMTVPANAPDASGELDAFCEPSGQQLTTQFTIATEDTDEGDTPVGGVDTGQGGGVSTGLGLVTLGAAAGLLLLVTGLVLRARRA